MRLDRDRMHGQEAPERAEETMQLAAAIEWFVMGPGWNHSLIAQ